MTLEILSTEPLNADSLKAQIKQTKSTCPYCGVGCGVIIDSKIEAGVEKINFVKGDPNHPANFGRLCTKGATLHLSVKPDNRACKISKMAVDRYFFIYS